MRVILRLAAIAEDGREIYHSVHRVGQHMDVLVGREADGTWVPVEAEMDFIAYHPAFLRRRFLAARRIAKKQLAAWQAAYLDGHVAASRWLAADLNAGVATPAFVEDDGGDDDE